MWNASLFEGLSLPDLHLLNDQLRQSSTHLKYDSSLATPGSPHTIANTNTKAVLREVDEDKASLPSTAPSEMEEDVVVTEVVSQRTERMNLLSCETSSALSLAPDHTDNMSREVQFEGLSDGRIRVTWVVEAKKLSTKDQQIMSPRFEISQAIFRIMLKPKSMGAKKGQTTFKKSSGKGSVTLKLVESAEPLPQLRAHATVGTNTRAKKSEGGSEHNFGQGSLYYLGDDWDFCSAVDSQTSTFAVSIDVSPKDGAAIEM